MINKGFDPAEVEQHCVKISDYLRVPLSGFVIDIEKNGEPTWLAQTFNNLVFSTVLLLCFVIFSIPLSTHLFLFTFIPDEAKTIV